jgi:arylsulfatase A-like enzyme
VHGVKDNDIKLPEGEVGIAEVFRHAGYVTQYIGKWHLNGLTENPIQDPGWVPPRQRQGFEKWLAFNFGHTYYDGHYYEDRDPVMRTIPDGVYEPDWQTEQAISFITANQASPFFLFLSIGTPHEGTVPDTPPGGDYLFPYDPDSLTLRPNVDYPDLDYARQEYADYYGIVSNLDWNVGRIMEVLDTLGLANRTIVAITSDHGDYLGSHYGTIGKFRGKKRIEAESLDVPFILRYPNRVAPVTVADVFNSVDVLPTLLGLCSLRAPSGVMGRNFSPTLTGGGQPIEPPWGPVPSAESAFVGVLGGTWVGLRTVEYSLECNRSTLAPTRLFDNESDPYQMTNVVDDPAYEAIRNALHDELLAWMDYVQPRE